MACFLVPAAEAIVTTTITKIIEHKEKTQICMENAVTYKDTHSVEKYTDRNCFSRKLKWLNTLLWGGSALLAFEHLWHGEITPFFPFLTAANSPEELNCMFQEMGTVGVTMAILVTLFWGGMVLFSTKSTNKKAALERSKS